MREDSTLTPARVNSRVNSIDIMRGFTILLMAFVNDLRDFVPVKDVPQWLRHMEVGIDGFTFVDLIVPVFMFLLGVSVPLALGKRLSHNDSTLRIVGHVLIRSGSLIVMGLMDVNRWEGKLGTSYGMMLDWPLGLWKFLAWTLIFVVWLDFPKESRWAVNAHRVARVVGLAGLIWLAFVFRTSTGGRFTTSWWGTLGELGWAYLLASGTWLMFRNNRMGIIGVFVLLHSAYIGMESGFAEGNRLVDWIGPSILGERLPTLSPDSTWRAAQRRFPLCGANSTGAGPGVIHRDCRNTSATGRRSAQSFHELVAFCDNDRPGHMGATLLVHRCTRLDNRAGPFPHHRQQFASPLPAFAVLDIRVLAHWSDILRHSGGEYRPWHYTGVCLHANSRRNDSHCDKKSCSAACVISGCPCRPDARTTFHRISHGPWRGELGRPDPTVDGLIAAWARPPRLPRHRCRRGKQRSWMARRWWPGIPC